jgi:hypothetical protein
MKLEVTVNCLKTGSRRFVHRGETFDSSKAPIPSEILAEYNSGRGHVIRLDAEAPKDEAPKDEAPKEPEKSEGEQVKTDEVKTEIPKRARRQGYRSK